MTIANVYLTFKGNCEAAFNFYKSVFGGEFPYVGRFSEMPPQEGVPPIQDQDKNKIMHISLPISEETTLMGSDAVGSWADHYKAGNNISISIYTDSTDEADRLFSELSDRGEVIMPMDKKFWGGYFGMLKDKFGISWMVAADFD